MSVQRSKWLEKGVMGALNPFQNVSVRDTRSRSPHGEKVASAGAQKAKKEFGPAPKPEGYGPEPEPATFGPAPKPTGYEPDAEGEASEPEPKPLAQEPQPKPKPK